MIYGAGVHLCCERDLWGLERVVWREVDGDEENTTGIWAVGWAHCKHDQSGHG